MFACGQKHFSARPESPRAFASTSNGCLVEIEWKMKKTTFSIWLVSVQFAQPQTRRRASSEVAVIQRDSSSDESAVQSPKSFRTVLIGHYGWFLGVSGASFFYRSFEISKLKFTGQSSFGPPFKPRKRMKPPSPTSPTGHFLVMIACSGFC
uniref:Secreted protein n=1 Tax=Mesocestoides corti TaxID=53468 RepID=A0A5K3FVD0_MESCO